MAAYPTDLTDAQWQLIQDVFNPVGRPGKPAVIPRRRIVDAILYLARTGAPWRYLPSDYPPWGAVWQQYRRWRKSGVWEQAMTRLRERVRLSRGRAPDPTMLMIDAQVVKGGRNGPTFHQKGGRGGRVMGAKRTLIIDITGSPVACRVHSAAPHDVRVGRELLGEVLERLPSVQTVIADRGYRGLRAVCQRHGVRLVIKAPPVGVPAFTLLRPLWRVEDAFARLGRWRRLARSFEGSPDSARCWMEIAATALLLTRL